MRNDVGGYMTDTDLDIKIWQKRRELKNLIDRSNALKRDLNHLNLEIERETQELKLMEQTLCVEVIIERLKESGDIEKVQEYDINALGLIFFKLDKEEIKMLYDGLHKEK